MKNNIKISILVPVYNTSKFLVKCIRSIMEQDFRDIEIICVNDGSTDNSLEILNKLSKEDTRVKIIDKKNGGLTSARNAALEVAQGKYCLNIDSDDWIEQGYIRALYERAEKDNLDITISNIIFDYFNDSSKNYILNDLEILDEKVISGEEYINIFLKNNFYGYTWNKLIKTEVYKKNNLKYNEDIFLFEDVEIVLKIAKYSKKIGKLNKAYYHYIQHESNGSRKSSMKKVFDIEKCFNVLLQEFEKNKDRFIKLNQRKYLLLLYFLKDNYDLKNNLEYKKYQEKYLKENKKIPFLKFEYEKVKLDIIYCNILKIFSYVKIMNLFFEIDKKIIKRLRNRRTN